MRPVTDTQIRASFVNGSRRDAAQATPPADLGRLDWDRLDYLGWTDPKNPRRAYVVTWLDDDADAPTGMILRAADSATKRNAVCAWCEDVIATNEVSLFVAKRAGAAGRDGNTLGTLICRDFACSANARRRPTIVEAGDDADGVVARRVAAVQEHCNRFVASVARG